eukprot:TRINITY_DN49892_c0_g1_i1.p1 TRINITY_DN49892_c0_g1~~TRINITY_DN49892_c0_g1_i1.p1  ORF type:complete len:541 (+),score=155.87 TRINITY_DN49892_c0_g1_i1:95-1624(+)
MPGGVKRTPARQQKKWTITVEKVPDGAPPKSPRTRCTEQYASEPEEEAAVLKVLSQAGLPPGSPVARVRDVAAAHSPCCSPIQSAASPGNALSPGGRKFSNASQRSGDGNHSGLVHSRSSGSGEKTRPDFCPLFPSVRCAPRRESWVPPLNRLLQGEQVSEVLQLSEWNDLMSHFSEQVASETGCPEVAVGEGHPPVRVVGDLHGQLVDLLHCVLGPVLRGDVPPARWVFLGDLVDRGACGAECLAIVALLKVCFPDRVTVLRGNHEDAPVTFVYGFWQECESKFPGGQDGRSAWYSANLAFVNMPVAAVLHHTKTGRKIWCCHGGLSPHLMGENPVEVVNQAQRRKYGEQRLSHFMSDFDRPHQQSSPMRCPVTTSLVEGLLWSDPHEGGGYGGGSAGGFLPSERGAGCQWTAGVSRDFCAKNGFDFICRAHQMQDNGFMWEHGEKVLTVFSASDYCGCENKGAVLTVHPDWRRELTSYDPPPPDLLPAAGGGVQPVIPYFDMHSEEE